MTQVLSGAGMRRRADDGHAAARGRRRRPRRPSTARPAPYYDYEEPPRGRSIWPWLLALGLIIAGAIGGWFLYTKIQDQLNSNRPVAVPDVTLLQQDLAVQKIQQAGPDAARRQARRATRCRRGRSSTQDPAGGAKIGKGSTVTLTVSTGQAEGARCPTCAGDSVTDAITALAELGLNPKIVARLLARSRPTR